MVLVERLISELREGPSWKQSSVGDDLLSLTLSFSDFTEFVKEETRKLKDNNVHRNSPTIIFPAR